MNDHDYIKSRFENDGLDLPSSLEPDVLGDKIKATGRKRTWARPALILAACACFAIVLIPTVQGLFSRSALDDLTVGDDGLYHFKNYRQLNDTIEDMMENGHANYLKTGDGTVDLAMTEDAEAPALSEGQDHSSTYTQEDDVDESDIVKTDGRYIYHLSGQENRVLITRAKDGVTKRIAAVGDPGDSLIRDLYINDDQLILISDTNDNDIFSTAVTVYNIRDRAKPTRLGRYTQTGSLLSSRMTGGKILLVTSQTTYIFTNATPVPAVSYDDGDFVDFDIDDIQCVPDPVSPSYTVVGLIDPSDGRLSEKKTTAKAVLGGSEQVYCSSDELYITASTFDLKEETQIIKVSFGDGKLRYSAFGTVDGGVNDQFSMDSSKGTFKIATTDYRDGGDTNNLFILDDKLKEVGSLRNFARDEHIEAVRYIGDYAYVITYEETDPLFIIDLSDPSDPVIDGHVKISGFSTLLVPVDDKHLLGFGYSTESTDAGEATDGLKLALFDISDPSDPKVSDSMELSGVSSQIQYDHKALLVGPNNSYYAVPYEQTETDYGIAVFEVGSGKIKLKKDLAAKDCVERCIYIEDWIYGICSDDTIRAFRI